MLKVNVLSPADKLIFRYERARILVQRFSIRVIFIVLFFEAERQTTGTRFLALSKVLPARIRLQSLRISAEGASVAGVAETREDVVSVASALQNLDFVASVNSPISNIVREKNNQFRMDLKFK